MTLCEEENEAAFPAHVADAAGPSNASAAPNDHGNVDVDNIVDISFIPRHVLILT